MAYRLLFIMLAILLSVFTHQHATPVGRKFCIEKNGVKKFWNADAWEYLSCAAGCKNGIGYAGCGHCCGTVTIESSPEKESKVDAAVSKRGRCVYDLLNHCNSCLFMFN